MFLWLCFYQNEIFKISKKKVKKKHKVWLLEIWKNKKEVTQNSTHNQQTKNVVANPLFDLIPSNLGVILGCVLATELTDGKASQNLLPGFD